MFEVRRVASHRIFIQREDLLLRNHVVELKTGSGEVLSYYPFTEETGFTEWLSGLIIISSFCPAIPNIGDDKSFETYIETEKKTRSISSGKLDNILLKAYYISDFNVTSMSLSDKSRVTQLY